MKKLLPLIILLSINTSAQTLFGAKAGLNISNSRETVEDTDAKVGAYFGAYANIKIYSDLSFQPELLYSGQGYYSKFNLYTLNENSIEIESKHKNKINLDYINIPLMFKYYPIKKLNIEVGPQIGLLVNAKSKIKKDIFNNNINKTIDIKDQFKTIDISINIGLEYEFKNKININTRYNYGLTNISNDIGKVKNSIFSIGCGYSFN